MDKKRLCIVIGVVVLVIVAVLVVWLCGRDAKPDAEPEPQEQTENADAQGQDPAQDSDMSPDETAAGEAQESAQIIESEGDLIITIPLDANAAVEPLSRTPTELLKLSEEEAMELLQRINEQVTSFMTGE